MHSLGVFAMNSTDRLSGSSMLNLKPRRIISSVSGCSTRWRPCSRVGCHASREGKVRGDVYPDRYWHGRFGEWDRVARDLSSKWTQSSCSRTHMVGVFFLFTSDQFRGKLNLSGINYDMVVCAYFLFSFGEIIGLKLFLTVFCQNWWINCKNGSALYTVP